MKGLRLLLLCGEETDNPFRRNNGEQVESGRNWEGKASGQLCWHDLAQKLSDEPGAKSGKDTPLFHFRLRPDFHQEMSKERTGK
jgi:hypothetical protein